MKNTSKGSPTNQSDFEYEWNENILFLRKHMTLPHIEELIGKVLKDLPKFHGSTVIINLDNLDSIDSAGVTGIYYLQEKSAEKKINCRIEGGSDSIREKLEIFKYEKPEILQKPVKIPYLALLGDYLYYIYYEYILAFFTLTANVLYWSVTDIFKSKTTRKGEFYNQAVNIGVNAVYIVVAMAFIIGLVLALQSVAQLRNFGANIFIVDLTVIAMMREMGPLITAILVAGRSGSAIAAEIATMKVTSELDALKTMGLNPVRFVIVPKMHGSIITMPFLTILADLFGILGGMLIAYLYLDIIPTVFINRMGESLYNRDILIGIFKSFVFASLIVLTGSFFGLRVGEGAEGVGKVTTLAVVVAISLVIVADSILGLMFY